MSGFLGDWVKAIAGAALLCSAAISITPKGKVKNVLRLVCGLVLICAIMSPLLSSYIPETSMSISEYRLKAKEITQGAAENSNSLSRTLIEAEINAYISDKASDMGETLQSVSVGMAWSDEGFWYPTQVKVIANVSELSKNRLSTMIEGELGIPQNCQHWSSYEN